MDSQHLELKWDHKLVQYAQVHDKPQSERDCEGLRQEYFPENLLDHPFEDLSHLRRDLTDPHTSRD